MNRQIAFSFLFLFIAFIAGCSEAGKRKTTSAQSAGNDTIPAVQVFVPGFSVKALPLTLTNINVVRYGPDGRLYGLAYDGHIYVLTDTDGDGLEDKADYWWDKAPLVMPVGMVIGDDGGIYVTSKNKVSVIKDVDKDGKAETEEVITKNWIEPVVFTGTTSTGVDAFGITRDKAGNIYFALGAADYTRAYMIDSLSKSHYDIKSERGTILKVAPGSGRRKIYCTGTRFPVAMAFNSEGDLFVTDQEGATWLPNGNPLDELLHIQEGRHYGFPPRHPKYLPNVIDEPSVYDYKPQHQSTCGINFIPTQGNGAVFGPAWWAGDAIVCGYSRGKVYRTKLVKTPAGYVAQNSIIASLPALTVDACISPKGDMVVSTHSGPPDWGFGPQAQGKLYKVFYTNRELPQPVVVWASKPDQVKIAFDKPLKRSYLTNLPDKVKIEYGEYVGAGDRFEVQRPGYKAVERQMGFPREALGVKSADLSDDGKTLVLNTFSHTVAATYAVTLPAFDDDKKMEKSIPQRPDIDLSYELSGVEVNWQAASGNEKWSGWLPSLNLAVSNAFMQPVSEYQALKAALAKPGKATWKTQLNLWNMLHPETQPESDLDYILPPEDVSLVLRSSAPLEIKAPLATISASREKGEWYETKVSFNKVTKQACQLEISMPTGSKEPVLDVHYFTNEDARPRALHERRFFVPWLKKIYNEAAAQVLEHPELAGGNWGRGKKLFYGEANCSTCHSVEGKGKSVGPDLSNLVYRDYNSVLRDINDPSAAINPDYLAHQVTLRNGKGLTGMVAYKKDSMIVRDVADNRTVVSLQDVKSTTPLRTSLMTAGLDKMLGAQKMKDLLTYLLTTLKPANLQFPFLPPIRSRLELNTVLRNSMQGDADQSGKPLRILWVSGPKDHGPDEHDYPLQQRRWAKLLSMADNVKIDTITRWPTEDQFNNADVVVFYWDYPAFTEENGKQLDKFLERGGGMVYLHYAVDATANPQALANRIGLAWKGGSSKFRHGRVELDFSGSKHPITEGFGTTVFEDESYWELVKGNKEINVLATGKEDGHPIPLIWTTTAGKGKVFVSILGHFNWTFDDPLFRLLLLRGIAWAGDQPINRLEDLTTIGARLSK